MFHVPFVAGCVLALSVGSAGAARPAGSVGETPPVGVPAREAASVSADEPVAGPSPRPADDAALWRAFERSGVGAHLANVAGTVAFETAAARASCDAPPRLDALASTRLFEEAISFLARELSAEEIDRVERFFDAPPGARVVAAERASGAIDEKTFDRRLAALRDSSRWTPARRARLRSVLSATRAGEFVAVFEGGLSSLTELAGLCRPDEETLAASTSAAEAVRADSAFYGFFVTRTLIEPSGVVFEDVDDEALDALAAFANTPTGKRWYGALIEATGESLAAAGERLAGTVGVRDTD